MYLQVTLVVDEKKNKVQFAECDHEFVDVLLSFLTLPLGTIVKLLNKQSELGCMDKLYQSVENLQDIFFDTTPCKTMLLAPRSIADLKYEKLAENICDELNLHPKNFYLCPNWMCAYKSFPYFSSLCGTKCGCGRLMDRVATWPEINTSNDVFVKKGLRFLLSDDLHVSSVYSVGDTISFMEEHNIANPINFKERKIQINKSQVVHLLKRSLLSKTPLTDIFLEKTTKTATTHITSFVATKIKTESIEAPIKQRQSTASKSASMMVKIFESRKGLLVEAGNEFVDLAFSFLTLPLGRAISLLGESFSSSSPGCIHHIYKFVEHRFPAGDYKEMLLRTKLPSYYNCGSKVLKVDEIQPRAYKLKLCEYCYNKDSKGNCSHVFHGVLQSELNPKLLKVTSKNGGGFTRNNTRFVINTDVMVKPFSVSSTMQLFTDLGFSVDSVKERVVAIGKTKALSFLGACLTSSYGIIESLLK